MKLAWRFALIELPPVRALVSFALLVRGGVFSFAGRKFRALDDFCRAVRLANLRVIRLPAQRRVQAAIDEIARSDANPVLAAYLADPASGALASIFSLSGRGSADLFRDLIVLKSATDDEKGVILLKYARTFSAVAALLDLPKLMRRYTFVLEPCWAGYCDPAILMYVARGNPVLVQCFTAEDYAFIEHIGAPLVPLHQGPADWVDADVFQPPPPGAKRYDLVMVANWAQHKRHALLFEALAQIRDRDVRVLLCGFAWGERTADDIRREAASMSNPRVSVEIREKVPQGELAGLVGSASVFLFLSRKEGDNKALVEAMFAGVPAIVYDATIGGARSRINPQTGVLASDAELAQKIRYMLEHHGEFTPRAWALEHTGAEVATAELDAALRVAVEGAGGRYTHGIVRKVNAPNLAYKNPAQRESFREDYEFVLACRRVPRISS